LTQIEQLCTISTIFTFILIFNEKIVMIDQILTVKEVANYLKVNDRTIYRMAASGKIPAFKVGASWRFKSCDIFEWIEAERNSALQPILKRKMG
jgi:excisionase family DNA binding protein